MVRRSSEGADACSSCVVITVDRRNAMPVPLFVSATLARPHVPSESYSASPFDVEFGFALLGDGSVRS